MRQPLHLEVVLLVYCFHQKEQVADDAHPLRQLVAQMYQLSIRGDPRVLGEGVPPSERLSWFRSHFSASVHWAPPLLRFADGPKSSVLRTEPRRTWVRMRVFCVTH
jgi:hypothetical protein